MSEYTTIDCHCHAVLNVRSCSGTSTSIVQLILAHVQMVDQQKYGQVVFNQIFEIIPVACPSAKELIINGLEYLIDLTMHDEALEKVL